MRKILIASLVLLAACDGIIPDDGPGKEYCEPCAGEVPAECADYCTGDK